MKITILGATGSVGQELVSQALDAGHTVTVLVRNPEKLGSVTSRVTTVQGDVTDLHAMSRAITGADAVLSTLGHSKNSPNDVLAVAASNAITVMRQNNVKRLVVLANTALPDTGDKPTFGQRFQGTMMGMVMGAIVRDHTAQAHLIAESGLDWTVVRAPILANGPRSKYRVGQLNGEASSRITRANVADFMLTIAGNDTYVRTLPVVSQ